MVNICEHRVKLEKIGSVYFYFSSYLIFNLFFPLQMKRGGVYSEMENKFVFNNVLVGTKAKARFKISNPNKVGCYLLT